MPLLQLQVKSGKVDDGVSLTDVDEEPLTFTLRKPLTMNRPKPLYRPNVPPLQIPANTRREIWLSPEPENEAIGPLSDVHEGSKALLLSFIFTRGVLTRPTILPSRNEDTDTRRRVRFNGPLFTNEDPHARLTPLHPSVCLDEDMLGVQVKTEEAPYDHEGVQDISNVPDPLHCRSSNHTPRFVKQEFRMPELPAKVSRNSLMASKSPASCKLAAPGRETGKAKRVSLKVSQQKVYRKGQAYLRCRTKCLSCAKQQSPLRMMYGQKRHSLRRGRRTTGTSPSVKVGQHGRCAKWCACKLLCAKLELLEPGVGPNRRLRSAFVNFVRRLVHVQNCVKAQARPAEHTSNPAVAIPSIIITTAPEEACSSTNTENHRGEVRMEVNRTSGNHALREFLQHTQELLRRYEAALQFPTYQLMKLFRSMAHLLLQRSQPLKESGLQDWEQASFKELRNMLKSLLAMTAITKTVPADVDLERWQKARASCLKRFVSVQELVQQALQLSNEPSRKAEASPSLYTGNAGRRVFLTPPQN